MAQTEFDIVLRKLSNIKKYIDQLQRKADLSEAEYTQDFEQQLVVERLLHMLVGSAVDINSHIVVSSRQATPDPSRGSFLILAERGVLSSDLAQQLAPVVGLRNRLVYGRDDIDNSIVYQSIIPLFINRLLACCCCFRNICSRFKSILSEGEITEFGYGLRSLLTHHERL